MNQILEEISRFKSKIIAIDGYMGVGKTSLSKRISELAGTGVIHLDGYREGIVYREEELHRDISVKQPVIVEGVESIRICSNYKDVLNLYVDKPSFCQCPSSREVLELAKVCDWNKETMLEYIRCEKRENPLVNFDLDVKIIDYFVNFRPFDKAHLIFKA